MSRGPAIRSLDPHVPLVCDDPSRGWIVKTGEALFFLTTLLDGAPAGPRHFLGTVPAGDAFFGVRFETQTELAIIGVGAGLTELDPLPPAGAHLEAAEHERLKKLAHAWCSMLARHVEIELPEPDSFESYAASPAVLQFNAHFEAAWRRRMGDEAAHESERLSAEIAQDRALLESEIEELSEVVEARRGHHQKRQSADPLFEACALVGKELGTAIKRPSNIAEAADPVRAIAHASHVRYRNVHLGEAWWTRDSGPLLAFSAKTHGPCALLSLPMGGYERVDPITAERVRVDATNAGTIAAAAVSFYAGFPEHSLTVWDVIRFAVRGARADFGRLFMFGIGAGVLAAATPLATGLAFGVVLPSAERRPLMLLMAALVLLACCSTLFALLQKFSALRLQTRSGWRTQNAVWDRLLSLPTSFFRDFSAGDLSNRAMAVDTVREIITGVTLSAVLGSVFSLFSFALLFYFDSRLAFAALGLVLLAAAVTVAASLSQLHFRRSLQAIRGKLAGEMLQFLTAISKLRVAGAELRAFVVWSERFAQEQRMAFAVDTIENRLHVFYAVWPTLTAFVLFATVMSAPHRLPAATFLAFNAALIQFFAASLAMFATVSTFMQVIPIFERIRPILEATPEVAHDQVDPGVLSGAIEISHATFRYPGATVAAVDDMNFRVEAGEFVAIVGPSGAGKSSVFRLLLGFDQPETGAIYYDGHDLGSVDVQALRSQLGIVLQNAGVMPGSILENIIGTSQRTLDDAWQAAARVGLDGDIAQMPMGMQTYIMEGGGAFSGGQIQRILIARALVNSPKILLLDEATSALDNATQAQVKRSLEALDVTRIVIAHRLSTIVEADRIIVIDRGRVVETGSYPELLAQRGPFYDLAKRQLV